MQECPIGGGAQNAVLLALLDEAATGKPGGQPGNQNASKGQDKTKPDNISIRSEAEYGTGKAYTLRRLKDQKPDLYARVVSGELSANAAAIEAAAIFRRKEIYELLHPETKHGATGNGRSIESRVAESATLLPERFTAATAKSTGKSERAIQEAVARGDQFR